MINCYIDPIFLAINESITTKMYSQSIYPRLSNFCAKLEELERNHNSRIIKFNITREMIYNCMEHNPFRFSKNISCSNWFKKFLLSFLQHHHNTKCDKRHLDENSTLVIEYENPNVPQIIMDFWNAFLTNCLNHNCEERNLDLLTIEEFGSRIRHRNIPISIKDVIDISTWLDQKIDEDDTIHNIPPIHDGDCVIGYGKHSQTSAQDILNQICRSGYITRIRRKAFTKKVKKTALTKILTTDYNEDYLIEAYIKIENGSEIFNLETTARNNLKQVEFIIRFLTENIQDIIDETS